MKFIGQNNIVDELNIILPAIRNETVNLNILFRAPSRYGKTTLALLCLDFLGMNNSMIYFPSKGELNTKFRENKRFHFIDEIHTLPEPEFLYPLMDSNKYTFFFATNESGSIKEPLANRCMQFNFTPYSPEEMQEIVRINLGDNRATNDMIIEISSRCRNSPGVAKLICRRLQFAFKRFGFPTSLEELRNIFDNYLDIREGGLTRQDVLYLEYLQRVGGISSLQNIIYGTHIDRDTVLREVEPLLLYQGKIKITSKGRSLC